MIGNLVTPPVELFLRVTGSWLSEGGSAVCVIGENLICS